jgi:hypothetical protein
MAKRCRSKACASVCLASGCVSLIAHSNALLAARLAVYVTMFRNIETRKSRRRENAPGTPAGANRKGF